MSIIEGIESFDRRWGTVAKWVWRILICPIFALVLYSSTAYLNQRYVTNTDFDAYKADSNAQREKQAQERREEFAQIGSQMQTINSGLTAKIDELLLKDSSNSQEILDMQRRIARVEDKMDEIEGVGTKK